MYGCIKLAVLLGRFFIWNKIIHRALHTAKQPAYQWPADINTRIDRHTHMDR